VAHTFARQLVQGNQGEWLDVDYILIDFVGPSMMSWLMTVNHRWTGALFSFVATSFRLMYSILMYVNIEDINLNDVATKLMSQLQPIQAAIVGDVTAIVSVPGAFVPPLPAQQPVLASRIPI